MATAVPPKTETIQDNYELELSRVRDKIKTQFVELINRLKTRESELLRELDNILASYLSYKNELEKVNEETGALRTTKSMLEAELPTSPIKSVHENFIFQLNTKLDSIEYPVQPNMFNFECDSYKLLTEVSKLGILVEKVKNVGYKSKIEPQVSVCGRGKRMQQLDWPHGLTIDKRTGNIYIADQRNHCVKVFNSNGEYSFKFGDKEGKGKMLCPSGVAIYGDIIRISQFNNCILCYHLDGRFISSAGKNGMGLEEFDIPFGLTIDVLNGDIYICDLDNNRIQILDEHFSFKFQFGIGTLNKPRDVKLSLEFIFVLDESNPCLHLYSHNHILQKSVISRGKGMDLIFPCYFFIDQTDNIIISDRDSNSVNIFTPQFELIHKITVSNSPMGVAVDNTGRVMVVCQSETNCLQMY